MLKGARLEKQVLGVSTDRLSHDNRRTNLKHKILSILKTDSRSNTWEDTPHSMQNSFVESKILHYAESDTPRSIRNSFVESNIVHYAESDIPQEVYQIPTHGILHVGTHFI